MNPNLTVTNASSSPQIQNPKSKIENVIGVSSGHKRNGKIAHLPKAVRDKINQWIDDGRTYPQIIKDLGDDAKDLKSKHFSEWRKGGYEDYLRHQEWRDQLRILRENGADMSELTDGPKFQETLVQIALTEIFRVLQERELKPDSLNYIRLFNALARLNREALGLRKYNDLLAKEQAQLKQLDPDREIAANEHLAIVDRTDRIFEMPRPRREGSPARAEARVVGAEGSAARPEGRVVDAEGSAARAASGVSPHRVPASAGSGAVGPRDVPARSNSEQPAPHDQPSDAATDTSPIENPKSKIEYSNCPSSPSNPSSPLPSRPCRAESPAPARLASPLSASGGEGQGEVGSAIENPKLKIEYCLECGSPLPPVPLGALRRPEDYCPSCFMRLPDIGLCYEPGFDKCLNCGATQPALLPGNERSRVHCHKCGARLHNPELPAG